MLCLSTPRPAIESPCGTRRTDSTTMQLSGAAHGEHISLSSLLSVSSLCLLLWSSNQILSRNSLASSAVSNGSWKSARVYRNELSGQQALPRHLVNLLPSQRRPQPTVQYHRVE